MRRRTFEERVIDALYDTRPSRVFPCLLAVLWAWHALAQAFGGGS
jgi:hypothetical protein